MGVWIIAVSIWTISTLDSVLKRDPYDDEAQIRAFAVQFDPQPFHTDETVAKGTFFKGLVASGWHTAAITMRLNVESGLPLAGGIIGAGGELNWPASTRPAIPCTLKAKWSRSRLRARDRGIAVILSRTINQRGEVLQTLKAKLVVPRKASS